MSSCRKTIPQKSFIQVQTFRICSLLKFLRPEPKKKKFNLDLQLPYQLSVLSLKIFFFTIKSAILDRLNFFFWF